MDSIFCEKSVIRHGWTCLQSLSVWNTRYSYDEYHRLIELLGYTATGRPLAIDVKAIRNMIAQSSEKETIEFFRLLQVFNHECSHYRTLCSTTAGFLTYALASRRASILRNMVSGTIRKILKEKELSQFIPLSNCLTMPDHFQSGLVPEVKHIYQSYHESETSLKLWTGYVPHGYENAETIQKFLSDLSLIEKKWTGSPCERKIDIAEDNGEPESRIKLADIVESHARLFDFFQLCGVVEDREIRERLSRQLCKGPEYTSAWQYLHRYCPDATFMDLAVALDLALMTPVFTILSPSVSKPPAWHDVHPALRFERIAKLLPSLPRISGEIELKGKYAELVTHICRTFQWPTPMEISANIVSVSALSVKSSDVLQAHVVSTFQESA